ncbi:hypothetical protein [Microbulbifer thermotolerans]|uniref:Uncharacterized protein n=1 Tax=Microbulbifer thermotolerans TaxID=252514 RepID=A0A143HLF0_MICTH|nr:hypothetical protein [Microbulbifer thermotolerans]AMX02341.1 hypothetical protein A3224_06875 [Microbulbifer thermotolerans]MCX2780016.1 hypothetical protein [Microbulbifer thermotolerans]MCX2781787.1 hypothetical protein [Microbulbifer thermotolerans]MCX2795128.1 hypothetical protein [Microbulbifer thermotolerans]MCX2801843.1 hypothetical protein [Microbulbifer thermotolerans]
MKKLIVPAIAVAAVGGYLYFQNMDSAGAEETVARQLEAAVEEAAGAEMSAGADMVADSEMMEFEGDVFADVPEHMVDSAGQNGGAGETVDEGVPQEATGRTEG